MRIFMGLAEAGDTEWGFDLGGGSCFASGRLLPGVGAQVETGGVFVIGP